jgi:hypothetical protein
MEASISGRNYISKDRDAGKGTRDRGKYNVYIQIYK